MTTRQAPFSPPLKFTIMHSGKKITMKQLLLIFAVLLVLPFNTIAQKVAPEKLNQLAMEHGKQSLNTLYELLTLPNDAHYPADIEKNIQWCEKAFANRGFATKRLETSTVPLLLAERKAKKASKTVLIYLQLDGQPVDSTRWFQKSPWIPALKKPDGKGGFTEIDWSNLSDSFDPEWRIFARSTSDSKGAAMAYLTSLDVMEELKAEPNFNIKVIMDFEEELGSPRLPGAVVAYKEDLKSDMLIIFDGPRHVSNEPTLTFGARGIATITLHTFGPRVAQHSGHYGNYAPNPALNMAQLLGSMKDKDGRVVIPGFYDGITFDEKTKAIMASVPDDEAFIKKKIGIADIDKVGTNYQESIQYPSLNIRGMSSGWVGKEVRTIVPPTATGEIDVRLVMESDPERLIGLIKEHIKSQGYYVIDNREPTEEERMSKSKIVSFDYEISYKAFRTDYDTEVGQWLVKAMTRAFGSEPIMIRTGGGSIPISPFVTTLDIPAVLVPTVNPDNNQHSPNENIRLGNYIDAIKTFTAIMTEKL